MKIVPMLIADKMELLWLFWTMCVPMIWMKRRNLHPEVLPWAEIPIILIVLHRILSCLEVQIGLFYHYIWPMLIPLILRIKWRVWKYWQLRLGILHQVCVQHLKASHVIYKYPFSHIPKFDKKCPLWLLNYFLNCLL